MEKLKKIIVISILIIFTILLTPHEVLAKELNIGDEIQIGTESFYIIEINNKGIKLLAKYNLYVGNICYNDGNDLINCQTISETDENYGIQSNLTLQDNYNDIGYKYGYTKYSTANNTNYANSIVVSYVNEYISYLNTNYDLNSTGKILETSELLQLGCTNSNNYTCNETYSWIHDTSFWTATAHDTVPDSIRTIGSDNVWGYCNQYYAYFGVRPVVIVDVDKLDNYIYTYKYLSGDNQEFTKGQINNYTFTIDANNERFEALFIDGTEYENETDFVVTKGSTVVTFTETGIGKLNTLNAKTYNVETKFTNNIVTGNLVIKNEVQQNEVQQEDNPNTGDNILSSVILSSVSLISLISISLYLSKNKKFN